MVMTEADLRRRAPLGQRARPVELQALRAQAAPQLPVALMDAGTRQRYAMSLQRTAGNAAIAGLPEVRIQRQPPAPQAASKWDIAPNPYAVTEQGGGARQEVTGNPYATENEPVSLSNPRFVGDPRLQKIAKGGPPLGNKDGKGTVKIVQQALIDLGFELVQHERDGDFGPETQTAIKLFRQRRSIGPGDLTARALGELDQTAPKPGAREEHYFDYERLFGDGFLDVTLAIGFDEHGHHVQLVQDARDWMKARGFEAIPAEVGKPEEFRLRRDVTYPTRAGNRMTREVIVRIKLVPPGPGAKGQFADGLKESEVVLYNGHARRGIGPDFDDAKSAAENFVLGVNSGLHKAGRAIAPSKVEQSHYVVEKKNDLEAMTQSGAFDKEKYRVWLFEACTTIAYFDELRGGILPDAIDRTNLDLVGTRRPAPLITEMTSSTAMLDGIIAARSIEQIVEAMDKADEQAVNAMTDLTPADRKDLIDAVKQLHVHEGAGDNPIAASAP